MKLKVKIYRCIAVFLLVNIVTELLFPAAAYALTGGPSQPEVQSFEPIGTSEMVDLFSGDFNYNIPLLDVGGYPINISYHGGVTNDQESSWVGLGWNINPGVINRNMRSLPDDFNGESILKEYNIKPDETFGGGVDFLVELFGLKDGSVGSVDKDNKVSVGLGAGHIIKYNNYRGVESDYSINASLTAALPARTKLNADMGLSKDGVSVGVNPSFELYEQATEHGQVTASIGIGLNYNSRQGLKDLSIKQTTEERVAGGSDNYKVSMTGGGARISFVHPTYVPNIDMNKNNLNLTLGLHYGTSVIGFDVLAGAKGFASKQWLAEKQKSLPGYGYLYLQNGNQTAQVTDFNREKDGSYTQSKPNLPLSHLTYDVYNVSGQGIGGMYRPHRGDIGIVYDSEGHNMGGGGDAGLEAGAGGLAHAGVDASLNFVYSHTGRWDGSDDFLNTMQFTGKGSQQAGYFYEPSYFRQAGEKTSETDSAFYNMLRGNEAVRMVIPSFDMINTSLESQNKDPKESKIVRSTRDARKRRHENISYLTAAEAQKFGLENSVYSYAYNNFDMNPDGTYKRSAYLRVHSNDVSGLSLIAPPHHISEITTVRQDGARYVYGIPAYNITQVEASFAVQRPTNQQDLNDGLASYEPGIDNTKDNKKGRDHFFSKTTLPPYAHSYLLTAILSPDYVDVTGDGPTTDDLGNYTKINYTRAEEYYQWRTPYDQNKAGYDEGLKTTMLNNEDSRSYLSDEKGSYVYGSKELWYIHSIETRTHIAEFTISEREDGLSVFNEDGGMGDYNGFAFPRMKKLDKITLYARAEKIPDKIRGRKPVPIKTVNFEYDYSLCPGIKNSAIGQGKLTLKKITFTYGNSLKGSLNPYVFHYADTDHNPATPSSAAGGMETNFSYDLKSYDRWGNYKPNNPSVVPNSDFPYTPQNPDEAGKYAAAWTLTSIDLPSGGSILVDYEADDYAYVQDRKAMKMFNVVGTGHLSDVTTVGFNPVNNNGFFDDKILKGYEVICFDLGETLSGISQADATKIIKDKYLDDIQNKYLYFRCLVGMDKNQPGTQGAQSDYVFGYAEVVDAGIVGTSTSGSFRYGYVQLKQVDDDGTGTGSVNPIRRAALDFFHIHYEQFAYQTPKIVSTSLKDVLQELSNAASQLESGLGGYNSFISGQGIGKFFDNQRSWIRLYEPHGKKMGGGHRVKRILLNDGWDKMADGNESSAYGQEYDYTTLNEKGESISSGVASYEPMIGADENPFRLPVYYEDSHFLAPDERYYMEEPFGESLFSGAMVGYSKVTVKNLQHLDVNVRRHATGRVVNEFWTARDFPVITRQTALKSQQDRSIVLNPTGTIEIDHNTHSQGYVVELNDMHGKLKAKSVYPENSNDLISGIEYYYRQTQETKTYKSKDGKEKKVSYAVLDNRVNVVDKSSAGGQISPQTIGVDFDIALDMRESTTKSVNGKGQFNMDVFMASILPVVVPSFLPDLTISDIAFRSSVVTKVINRYGLLDRVVLKDLGARIETSNVLYDGETGEVLLTKTTNQFSDTTYKFTYPAYWAYERMGPAYKNTGVEIKGKKLSQITNPQTLFVPGDELYIKGDKDILGWVTEVSSSGVRVVDRHGDPIDDSKTTYIKILRSGRRNMQSLPVGSITTMDNPVKNGRLDFSSILDASALEYDDNWTGVCNCKKAKVKLNYAQ